MEEAGRWLTYSELGQAFGISPEAARQHARRNKWPRRTPNAYGEQARVLVPDDAAVAHRARTAVIRATTHDRADGRDRPDVHAMLETIRLLREALDAANARLDAAAEERRQLGEERRMWLELLAVRRHWWRRWLR